MLDSVAANELLGEVHFGTDELQLAQRALAIGDGVPKLDANKAISSILQLRAPTAKSISRQLASLVSIFDDSLLSQLFAHIKYLVDNRESLQQNGISPSKAFTAEFTRDGLLVAVAELSAESLKKGLPVLQALQAALNERIPNSQINVLFANIANLLEQRAFLRKYADMCANIDRQFNEPLDVMKLGLPVPTKENPEVYFQLKDDRYPQIKFYVMVKLEAEQAVESILIEMVEENNTLSNTFTSTPDLDGIRELYKKLPISRIAQHN